MSEQNERPKKSGSDKVDYDVGYRKTPKHSRFKPGQSGNPKGRPKGSKNFKTELDEELNETVEFTERGERKKTSKRRAILKQLAAKAMKGDVRAATLLLKYAENMEQPEPQKVEAGLTNKEADRLRDYVARQSKRQGGAG